MVSIPYEMNKFVSTQSVHMVINDQNIEFRVAEIILNSVVNGPIWRCLYKFNISIYAEFFQKLCYINLIRLRIVRLVVDP